MSTKTMKIGLSDSDKASMQAAITALVKASLITAYSSSATYAVGDFVYNGTDGKFYKCTTAITTAESWTSAHWSEATLNDVISAVNEAVASVNNKVEPDDICPELRAGYAFTADNLIATKGLTVNDDPMSFGIVGGAQKSAVGDGNASLNKLVCVDVVKNNHVYQPSTGMWTSSSADSSYADNVATFTATAENGRISTSAFGATLNHICMFFLQIKTATKNQSARILFNTNEWLGRRDITATTSWQTVFSIFSISSVSNDYLQIRNVEAADWDAIQVKNVGFIDLAQRYGSNEVVNAIIGTGTNDEKVARLLAFDPEILNDTDYDAGTLVPSKTAKLLSVGVNQWDEQWELGGISSSTGANSTDNTVIRSKGFIRVFSNVVYYLKTPQNAFFRFYDADKNYIGYLDATGLKNKAKDETFVIPSNAYYFRFVAENLTTYNHDICVNISDPNINGKYYAHEANPVTLPNYEGHGILKVVDGKVVADGTELYPDGNSKKRYGIVDLSQLTYTSSDGVYSATVTGLIKASEAYAGESNAIASKYIVGSLSDLVNNIVTLALRQTGTNIVTVYVRDTSSPSGYLVYELKTEEDIATSVYQANFPVEQGGTLQFLDENNNPIAGLQGSEIFYQKNIKAFVEAFGEAIDWDPARIERLANLSFTPEYVNITLDPSPTGAYARAQVYNATFTIVISAALTGTAGGSITFQDSEVDLSNFQTKPADAIYDMDGKKVSEAPTTADCNIASFVGRSKSGIILWSLLHSGVNKVKIHIEEAVPLDSSGNGKIDCRASLIL